MPPFSQAGLGQYYPTQSLLHQLDPRPKLVFVFFYVIWVFVANTPFSMLWMVLVAFAWTAMSRVSWRFILQGLRPVLPLMLLFGLMHLVFTRGGEVLLQLGPWPITSDAVKMALLTAVRLFLLILVSSVLTYTTRPMDLTYGVERLASPLKRFKVPVSEMALMMTIALRFIPTLVEEANKIMQAQMARGADFESRNVVRRMRSLMPLLVPLFINAFRRAEDLALAMEARGYRGESHRTRFRSIQMKGRDWAMLGSIIPILAVPTLLVWWQL